MKVLCNLSSKNIGGIVNYLEGFSRVFEIDNNFELIGWEVLKNKPEKKPPFDGHIIYRPFIYPRFFEKPLFENAKTYDTFSAKLEPIISWIEKLIKTENPDLVLIYGTFWAPWCLLRAAERLNIPVIHYYAGSLVLETLSFKSYQRKIFLKIEKDFNSNIVRSHIFPSEIARRKIENDIHKKQLTNSVVIHNGIDTGYFIKKQKRLNKIGFVFRWTEVKNTEIIFKLAQINKEKKGILKFFVVTDINQNHKDYKKLKKIARILPPMRYKDLNKFYSGCDVIVSPSNFETFGNVPLEEIFAGTPSLINNNMGVSEVFKKIGLSDFVIDFSDSESVYQHILNAQTILIPVELRHQVKENYSFEKIYSEYLKIFRYNT
jgi:glycosyltransferase involved in cell wall biosynthesis